MSEVFISYRHQDDTAGWATAIQVHLSGVCGVNTFKDVDSLPPGSDWRAHIRDALAGCTAALVLIGPRWLDVTDAAGRPRLDDPDDILRYEVGQVIANRALVIPVLVDADLPRADQLPEEIRPLAGFQVYRWYSNQPSSIHLDYLARWVGAQASAAGPQDLFSSRVLALCRDAETQLAGKQPSTDLRRIRESLASPIADIRGVRAVIGDAMRSDRALKELAALSARSPSLRFLGDRVEQLRDSGPLMQLIEVARWYERCLAGEVQLQRVELDELEQLLLARTVVERLGLRRGATQAQVLAAVLARVGAWTAVENRPSASPPTQRLARAVSAFYERLYARVESQSEIGEVVNA